MPNEAERTRIEMRMEQLMRHWFGDGLDHGHSKHQVVDLEGNALSEGTVLAPTPCAGLFR